MRLSKGVTIYTHETPAVQRARGAQLGHGDQEMPPQARRLGGSVCELSALLLVLSMLPTTSPLQCCWKCGEAATG